MTYSPLKPARYSSGPVFYARRLDSTQAVAQQLAELGAPEGTLVVCDEQTAGRGRQGRAWLTPPGKALAFSYVVRGLSKGLSLLPLAVAVAVSEACEQLADVRCQIKWPNDVWVQRRKIAGILIEARPQHDWAVVGVGLNVNLGEDDLPDELWTAATSLRLATGEGADREALLTAATDRLRDAISSLRSGQSARLLENYRRRNALQDREVAWHDEGTERRGRVKGVDASGDLVVAVDGHEERLSSGEVHLL